MITRSDEILIASLDREEAKAIFQQADEIIADFGCDGPSSSPEEIDRLATRLWNYYDFEDARMTALQVVAALRMRAEGRRRMLSKGAAEQRRRRFRLVAPATGHSPPA
jgi:hypothetical protein